MNTAAPCIACGKELSNVFENVENQPSLGLAFRSEGHYGSRVFDPMDGRHLEVNVCDDCLVEHASTRVLEGRERQPIFNLGNVLVGWKDINQPLTPFKRKSDEDGQ